MTRSLSAVAAMTHAAGADMVIAIHATIPVATKWLLRTLICGVGFMGWAERRIEEGQSAIVPWNRPWLAARNSNRLINLYLIID